MEPSQMLSATTQCKNGHALCWCMYSSHGCANPSHGLQKVLWLLVQRGSTEGEVLTQDPLAIQLTTLTLILFLFRMGIMATVVPFCDSFRFDVIRIRH